MDLVIVASVTSPLISSIHFNSRVLKSTYTYTRICVVAKVPKNPELVPSVVNLGLPGLCQALGSRMRFKTAHNLRTTFDIFQINRDQECSTSTTLT